MIDLFIAKHRSYFQLEFKPATLHFLQITFDFDEDVPGPIFVYYELTNFFQNNRRYLKSTSTRQLLGAVRSDKIFFVMTVTENLLRYFFE